MIFKTFLKPEEADVENFLTSLDDVTAEQSAILGKQLKIFEFSAKVVDESTIKIEEMRAYVGGKYFEIVDDDISVDAILDQMILRLTLTIENRTDPKVDMNISITSPDKKPDDDTPSSAEVTLYKDPENNLNLEKEAENGSIQIKNKSYFLEESFTSDSSPIVKEGEVFKTIGAPSTITIALTEKGEDMVDATPAILTHEGLSYVSPLPTATDLILADKILTRDQIGWVGLHQKGFYPQKNSDISEDIAYRSSGLRYTIKYRDTNRKNTWIGRGDTYVEAFGKIAGKTVKDRLEDSTFSALISRKIKSSSSVFYSKPSTVPLTKNTFGIPLDPVVKVTPGSVRYEDIQEVDIDKAKNVLWLSSKDVQSLGIARRVLRATINIKTQYLLQVSDYSNTWSESVVGTSSDDFEVFIYGDVPYMDEKGDLKTTGDPIKRSQDLGVPIEEQIECMVLFALDSTYRWSTASFALQKTILPLSNRQALTPEYATTLVYRPDDSGQSRTNINL